MKILLIHNFYRSSSPSGEDIVFRNEVELLKKNDIEVITYERHNDEITKNYSRVKLAFNSFWSRQTYRELRSLLKREKPHIAHFHNIWYLISPSAYYACLDAGVLVVQTLHNYRMFCVNGLLMRNGVICEECIGNLPWRGVGYGCYRNSKIYSLPVAFIESIHKLAGTWTEKINAYIALTEFGKRKIIDCGIPEEKIYVKPNFLPDPPEATYSHNGYGVFLGRLSVEKGVSILINAFNIIHESSLDNFSLKIIGDGPLRGDLENNIRSKKISNVEFTGRRSFSECMGMLQFARFLIMPAVSYEGFPMVIREAFACGKPVIASNLGAMAELVEDGKTGLLYEPGNPVDLSEKMRWMVEHEDACIEMGKNARKVFEEKYTAERNFEMLINIYWKTIQKTEKKDL